MSSSYKCVVGDAVSFRFDQYEGDGVVKFVGSLLPSKKGLWVGIERNVPKSKESTELKDETPRPEGFNGKLCDMKYFTVSKKGRGIFVPYDCVQVIHEHSMDDKTHTLAQQTELQEMVRAITPNEQKDYSLTNNDDQKIQANTDNNTAQQLQKAQQLLEASLLLLQNGILYGRSVDKIQLQQHCEESWQFLNKKYPLSASPMARNNDNNGQDEEKFITFEDTASEQRTQIKMSGSGSINDDIPIEQKKIVLTDFFGRYCDATNWKTAGKESYGVESYKLKLDKDRVIQVRMSFLYSMLLYLIQITGSNKRCIAHGTILIMPKKQQIETLASEFELILKTLQHNDDDGLYQYVYQYLMGIFNDFDKQIKPYSGKRIQLDKDKEQDNDDESDDEDSKVLTSMFKLKALVTKK
mmetsp:Transcript_42717/g.37937  ORF Transcript_42717/g.37937 Transcript_42717/m.37937 type:complete len:410 (+) Transcript_42717:29-1258(+)